MDCNERLGVFSRDKWLRFEDPEYFSVSLVRFGADQESPGITVKSVNLHHIHSNKRTYGESRKQRGFHRYRSDRATPFSNSAATIRAVSVLMHRMLSPFPWLVITHRIKEWNGDSTEMKHILNRCGAIYDISSIAEKLYMALKFALDHIPLPSIPI